LYFMLRRSDRNSIAPSLYAQPPLMKALPITSLNPHWKTR
jgi:hypothetical protein